MEVMKEVIEPVEPLSEDARHTYTIVGSGVIGLMVAHELASEGHDVTVLSREGMPHAQSDLTSANAIGQFVPWVPEEHAENVLGGVKLGEVTDFSRKFYEDLAAKPHETGVMPVHNKEIVDSKKHWSKDLQEAMRIEQEDLDEPILFPEPNGTTTPMDTLISFDTFSINTRKTLAYLAQRSANAGVKFTQRDLRHEDLAELDGIIINASGIGARDLDPSRKEIIKEYKGHTFVIKPPEGKMPIEALSVEDLIFVPREDGTVVCGALYRENPERPLPEEDEAKELLERLGNVIEACAPLVEGLDPDLLEKSEVLLHSAGYRIEADGQGIVVAPDEKHQRLLHAYGFGGIGWSVGPHFAKKIAAEAKKLHEANLGRTE